MSRVFVLLSNPITHWSTPLFNSYKIIESARYRSSCCVSSTRLPLDCGLLLCIDSLHVGLLTKTAANRYIHAAVHYKGAELCIDRIDCWFRYNQYRRRRAYSQNLQNLMMGWHFSSYTLLLNVRDNGPHAAGFTPMSSEVAAHAVPHQILEKWGLNEWVSRFLTTHQHKLGYLVPFKVKLKANSIYR